MFRCFGSYSQDFPLTALQPSCEMLRIWLKKCSDDSEVRREPDVFPSTNTKQLSPNLLNNNLPQDGELDLCKHQGVPQVQVHHREERRVQPHDLPLGQLQV